LVEGTYNVQKVTEGRESMNEQNRRNTVAFIALFTFVFYFYLWFIIIIFFFFL